MIDKNEIKKSVVKNVVKGTLMIFTGLAVTATVGIAIKKIVPMEELTKMNKMLVSVGSFALGGVAANAGASYVGGMVDDTISYTEAYYKLMKNLFEDSTEEVKDSA